MDFHTCIGAGQKTLLINEQFVLVTANHVKGNLADHKNQLKVCKFGYILKILYEKEKKCRLYQDLKSNSIEFATNIVI